MTVRDGLTGSYNQDVGVKLDIDEAIHILPVDDVPLQARLGSRPTDQVKVEWLEEELSPQVVTQSGAATGTGPWTINVDDAYVVRPGDVLQKRGGATTDQYLVDSITDLDTIVVSAFGAGTPATPADTNVFEIIGQYRTEGSDPEDARSVDRTMPYNLTQWGQEKVEVTRTGRKRGLYGQSDPYTHELGKKFKELAIRFERSMVHGQRVESADQTKRFMGGLLYYITTNSQSGVKADVKTLINSLLRACYDAGGAPRTLMVSPSVKQAISENVDATLRRVTRDDTTGGHVIEKFLSDFGEVNIVMNRHFPSTKGIALQDEFVTRRVFDPYFHELLAKTGDADKGHIVGEMSLEVKNEAAHGVLTVTDA